jgi:hypothetical protein
VRLEQSLDDAWVEHRAAGDHLVDRLDQPVGVAQTLLEQVGHAVGALT